MIHISYHNINLCVRTRNSGSLVSKTYLWNSAALLAKSTNCKKKSNFCEPSPTHCPSVCPSVKRQCPMKQRDCGSEPNNFTQQPSDTCLWKNNRCKNERGARLCEFFSLAILPSCYQSGPLWECYLLTQQRPLVYSTDLNHVQRHRWPREWGSGRCGTLHTCKKRSKISQLPRIISAVYLSEHGLAPVEICHHELQLQATCKHKIGINLQGLKLNVAKIRCSTLKMKTGSKTIMIK